MKAEEKYLLLKTVQDNNILPITSTCNMNCLFCSHHYNPPGIKVYRYGPLDLGLINELVEYLPPVGPVILGESATKIIEGEPFTHPQIYSILSSIRKKWPHKKIKITTNGSLLMKKNIKYLSQLGNIKLNVSVNCSNPEERTFLMNDKNPGIIFNVLNYLNKYNIMFNGSIVALPHIMGWESIANTVAILDKYKAETIRVFLPGFTRKTPRKYQFSPDLYDKLGNFIKELNVKYHTPVIIEPPILHDFSVRVIGVISDTPAAKVGIKKGDIITKINGQKPLTRVAAFNKINSCSSLDLIINRNNRLLSYHLQKNKNEKSGIILNYDLNPDTIREIKRAINNTTADNIIIITSQLGQYLIEEVVSLINKEASDKKIIIRAVHNKYFGGSIMSAGLLLNSDIIDSLTEIDLADKENLIILPGIIYDNYGKDLTGSKYQQIKNKFSAEIKIIN